eukprot:m.430430 g.430430  ORF g.430430 m.430430 type:complete len:160 (-) comp56727_c0_seq6:1809-2288(-)
MAGRQQLDDSTRCLREARLAKLSRLGDEAFPLSRLSNPSSIARRAQLMENLGSVVLEVKPLPDNEVRLLITNPNFLVFSKLMYSVRSFPLWSSGFSSCFLGSLQPPPQTLPGVLGTSARELHYLPETAREAGAAVSRSPDHRAQRWPWPREADRGAGRH